MGGHIPGSRSSLSPNMPTDVVVMLENKLSGRARCYTTSASTLTTSSTTTTMTTVTTGGENILKVPLISINGGTGCLVNNVNSTNNHGTTPTAITLTDNNDSSISKENNLSDASSPPAAGDTSSRASTSSLSSSIELAASKQSPLIRNDLSPSDRPSSNDSHQYQHPATPNQQLINGYESDKSTSQGSVKRETCI